MLFRKFNVVGIALADTIAVSVEVLFMYYLLYKKIPDINYINLDLIRLCSGLFISGGVTILGLYFFPFSDIINALLSAILGFILYIPFIKKELKKLFLI